MMRPAQQCLNHMTEATVIDTGVTAVTYVLRDGSTLLKLTNCTKARCDTCGGIEMATDSAWVHLPAVEWTVGQLIGMLWRRLRRGKRR
jgi:hypothetical protein